MITEYKAQMKICDGCGTPDLDTHSAAGHLNSEWPTIRGFDVCPFCEMKLRYKLYEKADVTMIEDILNTIEKVKLSPDISGLAAKSTCTLDIS